jgi:pyrroloquinoline quinone (PQQ) biosynthesis protein C
VLENRLEASLRRKFAQAERLEVELAQLEATWDFARHPFIERWSAGELSTAELQAFAGEHHHTVVALSGASRSAAAMTDGLLADQLIRIADDHEDGIGLWCEFAMATGWSRCSWYFAEDPFPQTVTCARAWSGENRSLAQCLATIYASTSLLAQLTPLQLEALSHRYGFGPSSLEYFRVWTERGAGDATLIQAALTSILPVPHPLMLVRQAHFTYRSYWHLLDGMQVLAEAEL